MRQKGNWVERLERKWGKYAIPHLMKYMVVLYIVGFLISWLSPAVFSQLLALDFGMVLKGQVWRLVTFIINPPEIFSGTASIFILLIGLYLYYFIGNTLEAMWGAFRFNLFYFGGLLACVLCSIVSFLFFGTGYGYFINADYIFLSMFLAYAMMFPNQEFLLLFFLPVKVKWLGIIDAIGLGWSLVTNIIGIITSNGVTRNICAVTAINIVFSMANFLLMFKSFKGRTITPAQKKRSKEYKKKINTLKNRKHVCTTCGASSEDNPNMEFRFCSRCDGNREYCTEHLFTHEHIKKIVINIDKDKE